VLRNNSLTELIAARGGTIRISICGKFDNGSDPVTNEDTHDVLLGLSKGIHGGIEDLGGNYYSQYDRQACKRYISISSDTKTSGL
jgi:hypothetical protein